MTPHQAFLICRKHGRNAGLEKIISSNPEYSYYYASDVLKSRWLEAENTTASDPKFAYHCAKEVIKGKLPEIMHNAMLAHGITNNKYAKGYAIFINQPTQR